MSYLPVRKWWMILFNIWAKCQNTYLYKQISQKNVNCFDLRVYLNDGLFWKFAHGSIVEYDSLICLEDAVERISTLEHPYIRIVLEKGDSNVEKLFAKTCEKLQEKYPNITFFGGVRRKDWKVLYDFKTDVEEPIQRIASMSKCKWLPPFIYSKFVKIIDDCNINFYDFI